MVKTLTASQMTGEIGEAAVRARFLSMGFQFDGRSRLEAGIDGIAEIMDKGRPLAKMIAVQVKSTNAGKYASEDQTGFTYLLKSNDLEYWKGSNLPVIIVLYRLSDQTFFWQEIPQGFATDERKLQFSKVTDVLDNSAVDRLAALTVPTNGFGYYVPPLGGGEEALVNILPIDLPPEMFVSSTPYDGRKATAILLNGEEPPRFDWVIKGGTFWSFHDPRESSCRHIVDIDQVDAIETRELAFHEDAEEQNTFAFLIRQTLQHQVRADLYWNNKKKIFFFRAMNENQSRRFSYEASKKKTESEVVNVSLSKQDKGKVAFVRHHAFMPRFELLQDQWALVINPTYHFTTNGFTPHSYPDALLSGKKRLDNSASIRGQVIMWHRFLTHTDNQDDDLFSVGVVPEQRLRFGEPPQVTLDTRVPEDVWGSTKKVSDETSAQDRLAI